MVRNQAQQVNRFYGNPFYNGKIRHVNYGEN